MLTKFIIAAVLAFAANSAFVSAPASSTKAAGCCCGEKCTCAVCHCGGESCCAGGAAKCYGCVCGAGCCK